MKTQHTPGPWFVNDKYIEDQHGTIAKIMRPEANSALIAAAPELLEALREITSELEAVLIWQLENNRISEVVAVQRRATLSKAHAAINRARGDSKV